MLGLFLLAGETSLRLHLWLMLFSLAFGWRTERIGGVVLDAQQVIAWLLMIHLLAVHAMRRARTPLRGVPLAGLTIAVGLLGYAIGAANGRNPTQMLSELGPLLLSVPVIVGLSTLVADRHDYHQVERVLTLVTLSIAAPGIVEYGLGISGTSHNAVFLSLQGFTRASFSVWGGSVAGYVLVPLTMLLLAPALRSDDTRIWQRLAQLAVLSAVVGSYLSGHRGAWLALAAGLLAFCLLARRGRLFVPIAIITTWFVLPKSAQRGLEALLDPSLAGIYDTSALGRYDRIETAQQAILAHPFFGQGLTSSGWVHADLLQMAANLGVPAALALLLAWFFPVPALLRHNRRHWLATRTDSTAQTAHLENSALLAAAVTSVVLLATQALIVISALAMSVYIVIGLLHARRYIEQDENPIQR